MINNDVKTILKLFYYNERIQVEYTADIYNLKIPWKNNGFMFDCWLTHDLTSVAIIWLQFNIYKIRSRAYCDWYGNPLRIPFISKYVLGSHSIHFYMSHGSTPNRPFLNKMLQ